MPSLSEIWKTPSWIQLIGDKICVLPILQSKNLRFKNIFNVTPIFKFLILENLEENYIELM